MIQMPIGLVIISVFKTDKNHIMLLHSMDAVSAHMEDIYYYKYSGTW